MDIVMTKTSTDSQSVHPSVLTPANEAPCVYCVTDTCCLGGSSHQNERCSPAMGKGGACGKPVQFPLGALDRYRRWVLFEPNANG